MAIHHGNIFNCCFQQAGSSIYWQVTTTPNRGRRKIFSKYECYSLLLYLVPSSSYHCGNWLHTWVYFPHFYPICPHFGYNFPPICCQNNFLKQIFCNKYINGNSSSKQYSDSLVHLNMGGGVQLSTQSGHCQNHKDCISQPNTYSSQIKSFKIFFCGQRDSRWWCYGKVLI